jgi:hypothetical protein
VRLPQLVVVLFLCLGCFKGLQDRDSHMEYGRTGGEYPSSWELLRLKVQSGDKRKRPYMPAVGYSRPTMLGSSKDSK